MKKFICEFAVLLFSAQGFASSDYAKTATPESCFGFFEGTITSYTCDSGDVTIPAKLQGVLVTRIGYGAFKNKQIVRVQIPNSVVAIESWAFYGNQLTDVQLPSRLTEIGGEAFAVNNLTSLQIPNGITTIEGYAFAQNRLRTVQIPVTWPA